MSRLYLRSLSFCSRRFYEIPYSGSSGFQPCSLSGCHSPASALDGEPYIHDPSTIMQCDGKYYTFGTGGGGLMSDDGWTWHSGAVRPGGGVAPDVIKIGDRYYVTYAQGRRRIGGRTRQQRLRHVDQDARPQISRLRIQRRQHRRLDPTASRTAMPSIRHSCSIPPMAGCGSPTEPTSASSGSSSSIPRRASALPATSPLTSPSTAKPLP